MQNKRFTSDAMIYWVEMIIRLLTSNVFDDVCHKILINHGIVTYKMFWLWCNKTMEDVLVYFQSYQLMLCDLIHSLPSIHSWLEDLPCNTPINPMSPTLTNATMFSNNWHNKALGPTIIVMKASPWKHARETTLDPYTH